MNTPRIVAIDDTWDNLEVVRLGIAAFAGQNICAFESPDDFLDSLSRETFDVALIDLHIPPSQDANGNAVQRDGITLLKLLRADPRHQAMVCIAITADAMPDDQLRLLAEGFDGYISKPVQVDTLWESVLDIYQRTLEKKTSIV